MKVQSAGGIPYPSRMFGPFVQTSRLLLICTFGFFGWACANATPPSESDHQAVPIFDASKFIICGSQPGVSEYTYALSLAVSDRVLDLIRPPDTLQP